MLSYFRRVLLLGTLVPIPALAQGVPATPAPPRVGGEASPGSGPEQVTVTARRRSEPLQKVPVSVSVITGKQAARDNLTDLQDILQKVPSANFRNATSNKDQAVFIRGLGTISTSPGVEPSVSTVIDGVVLARSGQATLDLLDIDHVEVLSGPQGTLFGKNASAGVVNVVTTQPTAAFHAYTDTSYFSDTEYRLKAGVSGTLVPGTLTGLINMLVSGYDGNVSDTVNDKTVNGYRHDGVRTRLAWTPSDQTRVTLGLDYLRSTNTAPNGVFVSTQQQAFPTDLVTRSVPVANALAGSGIVPGKDNTTINQDLRSRVEDDNGGASVTVDQKLGGDYTLTSVTAYRRWQNTQHQDYDQLGQVAAGLPAIRDQGNLDFYQASQEVRIASPKGRFFDYVAGLYYLHDEDDEDYGRQVSQLAGRETLNNLGLANYGTVANNYAIFGEGNVNLTKSLHVILGLRVLRDDLGYDFDRASTSATAITGVRPSFSSSGSTAENGYVDRIGLQYDLAPNAMTYFTYSRGYKGPAYNVFFNMQATDTDALKPETNNTFEVGLKSQLLRRRVTLDLAAFISDFSNYQANFLDSVDGALVTRLINAGSVSTQGVEFNLSTRPIRNLNLAVVGAYLDAHVDQFNIPAGSPPSSNVNGEPLPFAPRWKLDLRGDYLVNLSENFDLDVGSDYDWQTRTQYSLTETPGTIQDTYGIWDINASLIDHARRWSLTAIVKNVLDTHYSNLLAFGNLGGVIRDVPRDNGRYAGFTLHKDF